MLVQAVDHPEKCETDDRYGAELKCNGKGVFAGKTGCTACYQTYIQIARGKVKSVLTDYPEIKGFMLGILSDNFIKSSSQYKRIYDEKKAYYTKLHPEVLAEKVKGKKFTREDWTKMKIHNYAKKSMMNRFLVELWIAWYKSEGLKPPTTAYILKFPQHNEDPMVVPWEDEAEDFSEPELVDYDE